MKPTLWSLVLSWNKSIRHPVENIWHLLHIFYISLSLFSASQLDRRANLTSAVQLIALQRGRLRTSSQCITAGWGDIGDNNTVAIMLQEVNVTLLSMQTCRRRWSGVPITRQMVCATGSRTLQGFCSVWKHTSRSLIRQTKHPNWPLLPLSLMNKGGESLYKGHLY